MAREGSWPLESAAVSQKIPRPRQSSHYPFSYYIGFIQGNHWREDLGLYIPASCWKPNSDIVLYVPGPGVTIESLDRVRLWLYFCGSLRSQDSCYGHPWRIRVHRCSSTSSIDNFPSSPSSASHGSRSCQALAPTWISSSWPYQCASFRRGCPGIGRGSWCRCCSYTWKRSRNRSCPLLPTSRRFRDRGSPLLCFGSLSFSESLGEGST